MGFIKKNILLISGAFFGALAGFLYWKFIGCDSGSCAITSNPYNSTAYGFITGGLFFSLFKKEEKKVKNHEVSGDN